MRNRITLTTLAFAGSALLVAACGGSKGETITAVVPQAATVAAAPVPVAAPLPAQAPAAAPVPAQATAGNIVEVAQGAGQFNTLIAAVQAAGLTGTLERPGPFTVFAPTDAAFAKIPKATLDAVLADKSTLTKILTYHVLPANVTANQITNGGSAVTVEGQPVTFTVSGGTVKVNDATVVTADVQASNGVIHVIDSVLMPPTATMPETR